MGRPRKIRNEGTENTVVTAPVVTVPETQPNGFAWLQPFRGKENIKVGEPQFIWNRPKLIRVIKKQRGIGDNGQPVYSVVRSLFMNVTKKNKNSKLVLNALRQNGFIGV